jgi:FAD/FMN-containing dehydrogenase
MDEIPTTAIDELRGKLKGPLLQEGDPDYDACRAVWNARFDRRPALIARCTGVADVIQAVSFARSRTLPISVRGRGHHITGDAVGDGGLTLDMSLMKGVRVDPRARTAWAQAGVTQGEFDHETQAFGLATTGGICSLTGIAGVTLGGGLGWLMRKYGLALDNLLSLEMVTADGELRKVSPTENAELFSCVRGAHSNFGVVTGLEYRLHELGPTVLAGMVVHALDKGKEALRFYRDYTSTAPEEMSAWAGLMTSPEGDPIVAILACYVGTVEAAQEVVAPLKEFGPPLADMIQPMPYVQAQSMCDEAFPEGRLNYWKSSLLKGLSDATIDALVDGFESVGSPFSSILIEHLGGAVARVEPESTAFGTRDAVYDCVIMPSWTEPSESDTHIAWADGLWQAIQPDSTGGVYVNYLGDEGDARVRAAYGANHDRLAAIKAKYDPTNLFRYNRNIRPASS